MIDFHIGLLAGVAALLAVVGCRRANVAASPPPALRSEAYVWQALGRPGVEAAVGQARGVFDGLCFRAAELRWDGGRFDVEQVVSGTLPQPGCGVVVRIGSSASALEWNDGQVREVARVVGELAELGPREIQCDFDCPQRRLAGYRRLLAGLREAASPVAVVPTALPCWLGDPEFAPLARESGGFVLQVHSLRLPEAPGAPVVVFDPGEAQAAVDRAGALGVPFRVAMATYGCEVWFDVRGRVLDVFSEDSPPKGRRPARRAFGFADPVASAEWVADLKVSPPDGLRGIIWYRLPVSSDRRNWPWETLEKVACGLPVHAEIQVESGDQNGKRANHDVAIVNRGDAPGRLPQRVVPVGPVRACDVVGAYRMEKTANGVAFVLRDDVWPWLGPGKRTVIGWLTSPASGRRIQWKCE